MVSHGFNDVEDSSRAALKDTPSKWADEDGADIEMQTEDKQNKKVSVYAHHDVIAEEEAEQHSTDSQNASRNRQESVQLADNLAAFKSL